MELCSRLAEAQLRLASVEATISGHYFFPDVPHLLKRLRDHILDKGVHIRSENGMSSELRKSDFQNMIDSDGDEFKVCLKLTNENWRHSLSSFIRGHRQAPKTIGAPVFYVYVQSQSAFGQENHLHCKIVSEDSFFQSH